MQRMLLTANLRRQHEDLLGLADDLQRMLLDESALPQVVGEVRKLVARITGKLRVHATMEEEVLYQRLLASADSAVRAVAQEFLDTYGTLMRDFGAYTSRWAVSDAIAAEPGVFARETSALLRVLAARVARENRELYPLADRDG